MSATELVSITKSGTATNYRSSNSADGIGVVVVQPKAETVLLAEIELVGVIVAVAGNYK
jgi:hypothetical protein